VKSWSSYLAHASEVFTCCGETAQWIPITLAYLGLRPLSYPYELLLHTGEQITLNERTDLIVFWLVFARRHYPIRSADHIVVDVGANIGMFTLYAAREAPHCRVIAIEPFPDTRACLQSLVERNHLQGRVTILDCALAACSATGSMDTAAEVPSQYRRIYSEDTKGMNSNHRNDVEQAEDGISVRMETLDRIFDSTQVSAADLVKLNIHGSEYEVLMSAAPETLERCKTIAVQYHDLPASCHVNKQDLFQHMAHSGFDLISDDDTHRGSGMASFARAD
jgi:FkbM family methyltransferase